MATLHIEHAVPNFEAWKKAFDSDPLGRKNSGVKSYRILRSLDNSSYVAVDLEFDTSDRAQALLGRLRDLWRSVDVAQRPTAQVFDTVETISY